MRSLKLHFLAVCALAPFFSVAFADDAAVAYAAVNDPQYTTSLTNAANWRIGSKTGAVLGAAGEALPSDYEYIVEDQEIRTPTTDFTFPGKALRLKSGGHLYFLVSGRSRAYTFPNFIVEDGATIRMLSQSTSPTIKGKMTVLSSSKPVKFTSTQLNNTIVFDADIVGDETASFWIIPRFYPTDTAEKCTNMTCCCVGEALKNYKGEIVLDQYQEAYYRKYDVTSAYWSELYSDSVTTPARITVGRYCHIGGRSGATFKMKELNLAAKAVIDVSYSTETETVSLLMPTDTLTLPSVGDDPIKIRFRTDDSLLSLPHGLFPILKAPAGVTLNVSNFVRENDYPVCDLEVQTAEDGLSTLYVRGYGALVTQTAADGYATDQAGQNAYTFVSGDHWSNGEPPSATNVYYSTMEMRNIRYNNVPLDFNGRTLLKSGNLDVFGTLTINDLRVYGGVLTIFSYQSTTTLKGNLQVNKCVAGDNEYDCMLTARNNRSNVIASKISGNGVVAIASNTDSTGLVRLTGDNSDFRGRLRCYETSSSKAPGTYVPTLEFSRPESLGGAMPSYVFCGHAFIRSPKIVPLSSLTLDRANCGCYIQVGVEFVCNEGIEFGLKEHLTLAGRIVKTGAGTLALGGTTPNFLSEKGTVPTSPSNIVAVAEGAIKPLSAEVFNGLEVRMSEGTKILLDFPTNTTAGVGKYGMLDTNWNTPLVLPESGVEVSVDAKGLSAPPATALHPMRIPICTVKTTAAAAIRGKLKATCPYGEAYRAEIEEVTADVSGSTTFVYVLHANGFRIIVR